MNTRSAFLLSLAAIAAGVLMIVFNASVGGREIVLGGGILLLLAGVVDILITNLSINRAAKRAEKEAQKNADKKDKNADDTEAAPQSSRGFAFWLTMVVSGAAAIFGIVVISSPMSWISYIPVIFGFVTAVAALMLFYQLVLGSRPATPPSWLYIPAALVAIGAVVDFFLASPDHDRAMMCVTGIAFCLFGVTMLITGSIVSAFHKAQEKTDEGAAKSAEAKKIGAKKPEDEVNEAKKPVALDDEKA